MIFPRSELKLEKSVINPSEFTGICFEIIKILKEHYNFSYVKLTVQPSLIKLSFKNQLV